MIVKLILWGSIVWLIPLMYFMLANETKFKKNIAVGVTFPLAAREDEEVQQELGRFRRNLGAVCLFLLAACVLCMIPDDFITVFSLWLIWVDAVCILPYIPYVMTNSRLKKIKMAREWSCGMPHRRKVNLSAIRPARTIPVYAFVPAVVIAMLPALADRDMVPVYLMMGVCAASCWAGYRFLYRRRMEMVDENTDLTIALTMIRQNSWAHLWLVTAYGMAFSSAAMFLSVRHFMAGMILFFLIAVMICAEALRIEIHVRREQERLTRDSGTEWYVDDDDHWIGGILYYNPDDSHLLINARIGMNSTFNLAHPAGKVIAVLMIAVFAAIPFGGVFMKQLGEQEILITVSDSTIRAEAGMTEYEIPMEEIREIRVLDTLPDGFRRKVGTGMENLSKGTFGSDPYPTLRVILDPQVSPYILVETADGSYYLFGMHSGESTEEVIRQIAS